MAYKERLQNNNDELRDIIVVAESLPEVEFVPSGTLDIIANGEYDVTEYEKVSVNIPIPEGNVEKNWIERTLTEISNAEVTTVGAYGFAGIESLMSVNLPNVTNVENYAFYRSSLTSANIPNLTSAGDYAFIDSRIKNVNFPKLKNLSTYCFSDCDFSYVSLPSLTSMGQNAFVGCYSLLSAQMPLVTSLPSYTFNACNKLSYVDCGSIETIGTYAMMACYVLKTIIIRTSTVCSLSNTNAFSSCYHLHGTVNSTYNPEGLKDCYIYVPKALIENYKVATNWATFATQFRAIEDYPSIRDSLPLATPTITRDKDMLTIIDESNAATTFAIFVDDLLKSQIQAQSGGVTELDLISLFGFDQTNVNMDVRAMSELYYGSEKSNTAKWLEFGLPKNSAKDISSGKTLTSSLECAVGDLVIAAIATRDFFVVSDGWTLISTSDVNSNDTNKQTLSWAYKYATSTSESITVTQVSSNRIYINMVSLSGATGFVDNGYNYDNSTGTKEIVVARPQGLVLWACSASLWSGSSTSSPQWKSSASLYQIDMGTKTQSRLAMFLDQSNYESITFTGAATSTMVVGSLTIQGIEQFY